MRLICPNCSAQYEIDAELVPEEGRDVQCSSCGHTWFELPPAKLGADPEPNFETPEDPVSSDEPSQAARAIEAATKDVSEDAADDDDTDTSDESDPFEDREDPFESAEDLFKSEETEPEEDFDDDDDDDIDDLVGDSEFGDDDEDDDRLNAGVIVPPTTMKPRRPADAADLDILREEANRELSQRRAMPSDSLESQTDLGLDDLPARETPSRALMARQARSVDPAKTRMMEAPGAGDGYTAPQRDLLPDMDEINSTLKPKKVVDAESKRAGFRFGFSFFLFLFIAAIAIYALAPVLARLMPELEPSLISYVDRANELRDWINGLISGLM